MNADDYRARFTCVEEINGQWFVCTDATTIDSGAMRWKDRGNGPELVYPDNVYGPFPSESEAEHWLNRFFDVREL